LPAPVQERFQPFPVGPTRIAKLSGPWTRLAKIPHPNRTTKLPLTLGSIRHERTKILDRRASTVEVATFCSIGSDSGRGVVGGTVELTGCGWAIIALGTGLISRFSKWPTAECRLPLIAVFGALRGRTAAAIPSLELRRQLCFAIILG
jgi:hypothetical protein